MGRRISFLLLAALALPCAGQASKEPELTDDGLRAWLVSGGVPESTRRVIHSQFAEQRKQLPPWWPQSVADQEEQAVVDVDMVPVALPLYRPCLSETEVRLLTKMSGNAAMKRVVSSAMSTHERQATSGKSAEEVQQAGEAAATATAQMISAEEKEKLAASLTPEELAFAAKDLTPANVAVMKACTDKAYAQMVGELGKLQEAAVGAVVEKNRPALVAAKTAWVKEHPEAH